jgi:hypothetical protein
MRNELMKTIQYENIELIKPENKEAFMADLRKRTGLDIHRVSISKIDFLKDIAVVRAYYYEDTVGKS